MAAAAASVGCASIPQGPSVAVMPAPGMPFDQFVTDDATCRDYAQRLLGVKPGEAANEQVITGAVAGTALGAAAGAAVSGGRAGPTGSMAGMGLITGSIIGAGAAESTRLTLQRRYDIAYMQCMYAKGNQVPGYPRAAYVPPPPPPAH